MPLHWAVGGLHCLLSPSPGSDTSVNIGHLFPTPYPHTPISPFPPPHLILSERDAWSGWGVPRVCWQLRLEEALPLWSGRELALLLLQDLRGEVSRWRPSLVLPVAYLIGQVECLGHGQGQGIRLLFSGTAEHKAVEPAQRTGCWPVCPVSSLLNPNQVMALPQLQPIALALPNSLAIQVLGHKTEGLSMGVVGATVGDPEEGEVLEHLPTLHSLQSEVSCGHLHSHLLPLLSPQLLHCLVSHPVVLGQGTVHMLTAQVPYLRGVAGRGN